MAVQPLLQSINFPSNIASAQTNFIYNWSAVQNWTGTSWNAQPYTGSGIVNDAAHQQALLDLNGGTGSTTMQADSGKIAMFLNGYSTQSHPDVNQWSFSISNKNYAANFVRPWANGQSLHVAISTKMRGIYFDPNGCGYTYFALFIKDHSTGKGITVLYYLWDNRPGIYPGAGAIYSTEPNGAHIPFCYCTVGDGNYMTNNGTPFSSGSTSFDANHWFIVSHSQFQALLQLARNNYPEFANLSTNPNDFSVTSTHIQAEIAATQTHAQYIPGQFGMTVTFANVLSQ